VEQLYIVYYEFLWHIFAVVLTLSITDGCKQLKPKSVVKWYQLLYQAGNAQYANTSEIDTTSMYAQNSTIGRIVLYSHENCTFQTSKEFLLDEYYGITPYRLVNIFDNIDMRINHSLHYDRSVVTMVEILCLIYTEVVLKYT